MTATAYPLGEPISLRGTWTTRRTDGSRRVVPSPRGSPIIVVPHRCYERDEAGLSEVAYFDSDSDVDVDTETRFEHVFEGDEHRVIANLDGREVVDATCWEFANAPIDGMTDTRHTWTYDADDNPLRRESDLDADGMLDELQTFHYAGGRMEQASLVRYDGSAEIISENGYDPKGRLQSVLGARDEGVVWDDEFEYDDAWPFEHGCWYYALNLE